MLWHVLPVSLFGIFLSVFFSFILLSHFLFLFFHGYFVHCFVFENWSMFYSSRACLVTGGFCRMGFSCWAISFLCEYSFCNWYVEPCMQKIFQKLLILKLVITSSQSIFMHSYAGWCKAFCYACTVAPQLHHGEHLDRAQKGDVIPS
jgi:hypothetical protein